jgi:hypothetical protein
MSPLRQGAETWPAMFPGRCAECDEPFHAGVQITNKPGVGYCHVDCPEVAPEKPTRFQGTTLEEMGF